VISWYRPRVFHFKMRFFFLQKLCLQGAFMSKILMLKKFITSYSVWLSTLIIIFCWFFFSHWQSKVCALENCVKTIFLKNKSSSYFANLVSHVLEKSQCWLYYNTMYIKLPTLCKKNQVISSLRSIFDWILKTFLQNELLQSMKKTDRKMEFQKTNFIESFFHIVISL
jgi:hypothetical protein